MINLSKSLISKAAGSTFLTAVGSRFFKGRAPEGALYPYAVYSITSNVPEKTYTEHFEDTLIQISLFSNASGSTEIENMYTYLKTLYDECELTIPGAIDDFIWMKRNNATLVNEDHTTLMGTTQVWAYHIDYEIKTQLI